MAIKNFPLTLLFIILTNTHSNGNDIDKLNDLGCKPLSREVCILNEETEYSFKVSYFCHPISCPIKDLSFISLVTTCDDVLITSKWVPGQHLEFGAFKLSAPKFLSFTKNMLPFAFIIRPITKKQPVWIQTDRINYGLTNTSIQNFKQWGTQQPLLFVLENNHIFDAAGNQKHYNLFFEYESPSASVAYMHLN